MNRQNKCRSCGALIEFVKTKMNKSMPVNFESLNEEEKAIIEHGGTVVFEYGRHVSHFSNCPAASKFRKAKK